MAEQNLPLKCFNCPFQSNSKRTLLSHINNEYQLNSFQLRSRISGKMNMGSWDENQDACSIIMHAGNTFFMIAHNKEGQKHYFIQLLGNESEARKFSYELVIYKETGRQWYGYEGGVTSLIYTAEEIINRYESLHITKEVVREICDQNSQLHFTLRLFPQPNKEENKVEPIRQKIHCPNCKKFKSWYQDVVEGHYKLCVQKE